MQIPIMWSRFFFATTLVLLLLSSCNPSYKEFSLTKTIDLGEITPIGLAFEEDNIWISDGDHNQVLKIDGEGKILKKLENFERPMHIAFANEKLYVPEFGKDTITIKLNNNNSTLPVKFKLDAPAGVAVSNNNIAIADFYNHRILLKNKTGWQNIGKKGRNKPAEFEYPTDVHFYDDALYIADAYNHRIQVFDLEGQHIRTFGRAEKMNAVTGIFVDDEYVYATDFENGRLVIYNHIGEPQQIIDSGFESPTDVAVKNKLLYVTDYKLKKILVFKQ